MISPSVEQNLLRGPPPHLSQHHPRHFFRISSLCKTLFSISAFKGLLQNRKKCNFSVLISCNLCIQLVPHTRYILIHFFTFFLLSYICRHRRVRQKFFERTLETTKNKNKKTLEILTRHSEEDGMNYLTLLFLYDFSKSTISHVAVLFR